MMNRFSKILIACLWIGNSYGQSPPPPPSQSQLITIQQVPICGDANDPFTVVFEDEFDGTELNEDIWTVKTQGLFGQSKGNYSDKDNLILNNGILEIRSDYADIYEARPLSWEAGAPTQIEHFTSTTGNIYTFRKSNWQYGYLQGRIKIPKGYGLWPAFWMFSTQPVYQGWNEIDVFEFWTDNHSSGGGCDATCMLDNEVDQSRIWHLTTHVNIAGEGSTADVRSEPSIPYEPGYDFAANFHVFAVDWDQYRIIWTVDGDVAGILYRYYNPSTGQPLTCGDISVGQQVIENLVFPHAPMHIRINTKVENFQSQSCPAGVPCFPGDAPTFDPMPATMEVDWIRFSQRDFCSEDIYIDNRTFYGDPSVQTPEHHFFGGHNVEFSQGGAVTIEPNANIQAKSANTVVLNPGFAALPGAKFSAWIESCGSYNPRLGNSTAGKTFVQDNKSETKEGNEVESKSQGSVSLNNQLAKQEIKVSPNPSDGNYYIEGLDKVTVLQVKSMSGSDIRYTLADNRLDITSAPSGVYQLVIIDSEERIAVYRLVKL